MTIYETEFPDNSKMGDLVLAPINKTSENTGKPGFFASMGHGLTNSNDLTLVGRIAKKGYDYLTTNTDDVAPEGWNPVTIEALGDVPKKYWGDLINTDTPSQQIALKNKILNQMAEDEYWSNGSTVGSLIGGVGGIITSPSTYLLPQVAGARYAKYGQGIVQNMVKHAPTNAIQSAVYSTLYEAGREGANLQDWFTDTLVNFAFASFVSGAIGAKEVANQAGKMKYLKNHFEGVDFISELNPDGTVSRVIAKAGEGADVGAAVVTQAQQALDNGLDLITNSWLHRKLFSASPMVRGAASTFKTVNEWTANLFDTTLLRAKDSLTGYAESTAESTARYFLGKSHFVETRMQQFWAEYVGLNENMPAKQFVSFFTKKDSMNPNQFREAVTRETRNPGSNVHPKVKEAAEFANKEYQEIYQSAVDLKLLPENISPVTAARYINRMYNRNAMKRDGGVGFLRDVSNALMEQNNQIKALMEPIEGLQKQIQAIKAQKITGKNANKQRAKLKQQIGALEQKEAKLLSEIEIKIASGEIDPMLLEGRPQFNTEQLEELEALSKLTKEEFQIKALNGEIAEEYIYRKQGKAELIDINKKPSLRKVLSEKDIKESAKNYYDTILHEQDEQLVAYLFDDLSGGGTNPLKARTLLIPDTALEPYLINDISQLFGVHANYMGKKIGMEKVAQKYGTNSREFESYMAKRLKAEYEAKKAAIMTKETLTTSAERDLAISQGKPYTDKIIEELPITPEIEKKIAKLDAMYDKEKDFIKDTYSIYWGNYHKERNGVTARILNGLRNFGAATMLGGVSILQIPEFLAITFKQGFWDTWANGIVPMAKSAFGITGNKIGKGEIKGLRFARKDLAHANLGLNTAINSHLNSFWGMGNNYHPQNFLERFVKDYAGWMGNLTFSNQIMDFQQNMTGVISQSKTMSALKKVQAGQKLTQLEIERLNLLGLDIKHADSILKQFERHGTTVHYGGDSYAYQPNFIAWDDFNAKQEFIKSIQRDVRTTILQPNLLDTPISMRDPLISIITQFWSYGFSATNSFLLPLLERPDANKIISAMMMMSAASLVDPVREFVSGQEVDFSTEALFRSGFLNGNIIGWPIDMTTRIMTSFENPASQYFAIDRFRRKTGLELIFGPAGSIANNIHSVANMLTSGKINEAGVKRAARLTGISSAWWARGAVNQFIESLELPKTKAEATGYFE